MILLSFVLALVFLLNPAAGAISVTAGETAPGFTLGSIDGKFISTADYKGKTVVMIYWKTDNERSIPALKDAQDIADRFKGKDLQMLSIIAGDDSRDEAKKILNNNAIKFPALIDTERKVYSSYGIRVYPSTVIIDGKGKIVQSIPSHALTFKKVLEGYVRKSLGEIDDAQLEEVLSPHREAVDASSLEAKRLYNLAMKFTDSGMIDLAVDSVKKAIEANPGLEESHMLLGFLYLENREADLALKEFRRVLEMTPNSNDAKTGLGGALVMKGDIDAAIEVLNTASVANPYPQMTYYELGKAYEAKGEKDRSMEMYRKAIEKIIHKKVLPSSISKCN